MIRRHARQNVMPVIIPAKNEERVIGKTLRALSRDVEPIVVANACVDGTAAEARAHGATVIEIARAGRVLAIQEGLSYLGGRALDPLICLDADTRPVFRKWPEAMSAGLLPGDQPSIAAGILLFVDDIDLPSGMYHSVMPTIRARRRGEVHIQEGNLAIRIATKKCLEDFLEIDNYYGPGEGGLYAGAINSNDGEIIQNLGIGTTVLSSGQRLSSLIFNNPDGPSFADSYIGELNR